MNKPERISAYLSKCPGAISGSGGHNQTFAVACALVNGFDLGESEAMGYLLEWNTRCQPMWSEAELRHKISDANRATHQKPRGHLIGNNGDGWKPEDFSCYTQPQAPQKPPRTPARASRQEYDRHAEPCLPAPLKDPCRRFLMAAFKAGESIGIAAAALNEEGRCVPRDAGVTLPREEWITRLDAADGDPNDVITGSDAGAFIRINPIKPRGKADADVVAFRHILIEFDKCSVEEQWNIITQSRIPCTAILHSGAKSIHAWVRVDAKDRQEYVERVKLLYDHFADYGVDPKNKNPSRFSRLPGMRRGEKTQDLLALNAGESSFEEWLRKKEIEGLGEQITVRELLKFDESNDPNCVLGLRWLCRGGSCMWTGPSGVGKSSLAVQAMCNWAVGRTFFGVRHPRGRPLKSLIVQAENDKGDLAEMLKGVMRGMKFEDKGFEDLLNKNLVFVRNQVHVGQEFAVTIRRLIELHNPDLVWIDPLLAFFGDDVSNQKAVSTFLRNWLNPISEATGVIWFVIHHTGKPKDAEKTKGWTRSDFSYSGTGSSELVNWARAVVNLRQVDDDTYRLMFTKRGTRAAAMNFDGERVRDVYLQHAETGIWWDQIEAPEQPQAGRPKVEFDVVALVKEVRARGRLKKSQIITIIRETFLGKKYSKNTPYNKWEEVKDRFVYDPDTDTYTA